MVKSTSKEAAEEDNRIQQLIWEMFGDDDRASEMFGDDNRATATSKLVGSDRTTTETAKDSGCRKSETQKEIEGGR